MNNTGLFGPAAHYATALLLDHYAKGESLTRSVPCSHTPPEQYLVERARAASSGPPHQLVEVAPGPPQPVASTQHRATHFDVTETGGPTVTHSLGSLVRLFHGKQHVDYYGVVSGEDFFGVGKFDAEAAQLHIGGRRSKGRMLDHRQTIGRWGGQHVLTSCW